MLYRINGHFFSYSAHFPFVIILILFMSSGQANCIRLLGMCTKPRGLVFEFAEHVCLLVSLFVYCLLF